MPVVDDLRRQPPDIDGVGAGKRRLSGVRQGGKDLLYTGLRVVKVAFYRGDPNVAAGLGHHLPPLDLADPLFGVKHHDGGLRHIPEPFQCRFAGVAARRRQHYRAAIVSQQLLGAGDEIRQQRKRHVLKGAGRPVEQLQHGIVPHGRQRRDLRRTEFTVCGADHRAQQLGGIVRQQTLQHRLRHFGKVLFQHFAGLKGQGGRVADIQPAVRGNAAQDGFGCGSGQLAVSGTVVLHGFVSFSG